MTIYVIGAGGHAKVVADALKSKKLKAKAFVGRENEKVLEKAPKKTCRLVNGIGSINLGTLRNRQEVYLKYKNMGFKFLAFAHSKATIGSEVEIGEGSIVMAGAVVQVGTKIGENSIINTSASIDHDCVIGSGVHIAPGVVLSGGVIVEDEVHIGTGASVIQGITIGRGNLVPAGAVVTKDIPAKVDSL